MPAVAWMPDPGRTSLWHAPALDQSQITKVEEPVRSTLSVVLSPPTTSFQSARERAMAVIDALGGEIDDPRARQASARVLASHLERVETTASGGGPLPHGF